MRSPLPIAAVFASAAIVAGCVTAEPTPGALDSAEASATGTTRAAATSTPAAAATLPACQWADVSRVVDGDTIVVRIAGTEDRVRYIGVDTPETVDPRKPVQAFGPEATALNKSLVQGQRVCLEKDITDRDRYGRLLRYVWLADGRLVNEELLLAGFATVVTYPPDVKYVESRYLPAQRAAREAGRGLWE
ncbi:MAG: thermonuclease family protein [Thermoflexaceae bacterium]|nr:thermonuclease family protein [Thermoflexaceae bacterium]